MTIYEMARHYYQDYRPRLWSIDRLLQLVKAGKLTQQEMSKIIDEG